MNSHPLIERLQLLRRDLGNLLFHFTRKPDQDVLVEDERSSMRLGKHASSVLTKIITEGRLRGSSRNIRGGYKCVCFTESPITELAAMFSMVKIAANHTQHTRYEPYGVAVKKEWLFSIGGRPVIYQPDSEYDLLPEDLRYRHVHYDPNNGIDFTWEREWRTRADQLMLDPDHTLDHRSVSN